MRVVYTVQVAKFAEKWPALFARRRCLDLSAGCGLVGARARKHRLRLCSQHSSRARYTDLRALTCSCRAAGRAGTDMCSRGDGQAGC